MINNLSLVKPLLKFEEEGDFYMLYVLKRKKDQPEDERDNHQSVRTIKSYCIDSMDYLDKRYPEIVQLCEMFKARAYIHVTAQNHKDVSLDMMVTLAERIKNKHHIQKGLFDTVVGQIRTREKLWIVDLDSKKQDELSNVEAIIKECEPYGLKVVTIIPTKAGYHLISKPFNLEQFNFSWKAYNLGHTPDIQKKNPTLLYLPSTLK